MKTILTLIIALVAFNAPVHSQDLTGPELLKKTIEFHDPDGNWGILKAAMILEQTRPNGNGRTTYIELINYENYFKSTDSLDGNQIVKIVRNNSAKATFNGAYTFSDAYKEKYRLSSEGIIRMKDYYIYLYGLPMKLTDPGTNLGEEVERVSFNEKEYLELKVTYDAEVGNDDWFFYIDPETYAMEGYKFYHQNGKGEYITLEGLETFEDIKMPKLRKWYTTGDSTYLGADNIKSIKFFE